MKRDTVKIILAYVVFAILIVLGFMLGKVYGLKANNEENTTTTIIHKIEDIIETTTETTTEETTTETTTKPTTTKPTTKKETTTIKELGLYDEKHDYIYLGNFKITGYTAEEGFSYGSKTASGTGCRPGICAMNRHEMKELGISYGDYIYVDGIGEFRVEDCTADWINNTVDIWVYTNEEAYQLTSHQDIYRRVNR